MKLNEKLLKLRKEHGFSQEELGMKINASRQAVSKWETGETNPHIDQIKAIAKVYDVSFDYLLNDEIDEVSALNEKGSKKKEHNKINPKIKKALIIVFLLIVLLLLLIFGYKYYIRIAALDKVDELYREYYGTVGDTNSGIITYEEKLLYKNGEEKVDRGSYKFYVKDGKRLASKTIYKNNDEYNLEGHIVYYNLDKEVEPDIYDDVVIYDLENSTMQEVDGYEIVYPIRKNAEILNAKDSILCTYKGEYDKHKFDIINDRNFSMFYRGKDDYASFTKVEKHKYEENDDYMYVLVNDNEYIMHSKRKIEESSVEMEEVNIFINRFDIYEEEVVTPEGNIEN